LTVRAFEQRETTPYLMTDTFRVNNCGGEGSSELRRKIDSYLSFSFAALRAPGA
jgi:hypothetical protein